MKKRGIQAFVLRGAAVGLIAPFLFSVCLFGTTVQTMVAGAVPTAGYWSGAPTPVPTRQPSPVQAWTGQTFSAAGGAAFLLWSVLGAFAGEGVALRRWGKERNPGAWALLGAAAGSLIFMTITLCGFLK